MGTRHRAHTWLVALAVAASACGGGGGEVVDEPVVPTTTLEPTSTVAEPSATTEETSDTVGVDFGDDGMATDFLAALFMPRSSVTDEQVSCINEELAENYPDGLPEAATDAMEEVLSSVVEACGLIP